MADIEFIFDFGSPNAYLIHRVLPQRAAEIGVEVIYRPALLGGIFKLTQNQAPMIAFAKVENKLNYERLEFMRFLKRYGLTKFQWNPHFPVTTLHLMRGAIAAQQEGTLASYVEAGMCAMWEEGANMADADTYVAALERHGVDGAHYLAEGQKPQTKAKLATYTDEAVARGVFGVPTFFVEDEIYFGKERLDQVLAAARG